jgi:hypothetical protein
MNLKKTKNSLSGGLAYSGIDRVDSLGNYVIENIAACCKACNYAKSDMTLSEFHDWAVRLGKNAMASQWG